MPSELQPDNEPTDKAQASGNAEVEHAATGPPLVRLDSAILKDVEVGLAVRLGELTLTVHDLLALKAGAVVRLGTRLNELVELRLGEAVVARGEIVAVGDNFALRIVDIAAPT
jgi:flagellar motor switch protein FliN